MNYELNDRAAGLLEYLQDASESLHLERSILPSGAQVLDFGIRVPGGLTAGIELADICMAGLGDVSLTTAECFGMPWPHVLVTTDHPLAACLFSQYAGWAVSTDEFFGMGSGPMRAASGHEEIFQEHGYREEPEFLVGVLESRQIPDEDVIQLISQKTGVPGDRISLLVAPTASQAGNIQVVARSVETALHKLHELKFDLSRIRSGYGVAPLPPVAKEDMAGIGRTNDAILYGARVILWVTGDDDSLQTIGPQVPSNASPDYGKPFLELFEAAGRDFYKLDKQLFSPGEIIFQNVETGHSHRFGQVDHTLLKQSFGM